MLTKSADDRSRRLQLLADLQQSRDITADQRTWLRDEWQRTQRGQQGERDAAHYIDSNYKDSESFAVLHDLRLVVDGEVAQIDHLLINRMLHFFLFETKCFNGKVQINEHGEFTVTYPGERQIGIPSPIEQSLRHERILAKVLDQLGISGRVGTQPSFHHAVLMHPKSIIERPDPQRFDTRQVVKADQIDTWLQRYVDKEIGTLRVLASAVNLHSLETLKQWGEKLARQHRPADPLALPAFMKPRTPKVTVQPGSTPAPVLARPMPTLAMPAAAACPEAAGTVEPAVSAINKANPKPEVHPAPVAPSLAPDGGPDEALRRKLVCVTCRTKITYAEGKFCWNNEPRFGGFQYCRDHQRDLPPRR